jgi:UDP-glucose 4-epimerase
MASILVTGGAGYIGAHICKCLATRGHRVFVLDDLSTGYREFVRWGDLVHADVRDTRAVENVLREKRIEAVVHCAARSLVAVSMRKPLAYYETNVGGTLALIAAMRAADVRVIVFSSSAGVYDPLGKGHFSEDDPSVPPHPYGMAKLMCERVLADCARAGLLSYVSLRYFNAAGASAEAEIGEWHQPETHLIPCAFDAVLGRSRALSLFGDDYSTPDGTAIRDYVHVDDLAAAHAVALDYLVAGKESAVLNLGSGQGHSVRQVLTTVQAVTGKPVPFTLAPRRTGDPSILIAQSDKARSVLDWQPRYTSLNTIVESAWRWHRRRAEQ